MMATDKQRADLSSSSSRLWPSNKHEEEEEEEEEIIFDYGDDISSPIELGQSGASLPAAEEIRSSMYVDAQKNKADKRKGGRNNSRLRRTLGISCVILLLFMIGLIVGVGFAMQKKPSTENTRISARWPLNGEIYDDERKSNYTQVKDFFVGQGISSLADFDDPASPQAQAASWLADMDKGNWAVPGGSVSATTLMTDSDDYHYMARYVFAVLYFATKGENWTQQFNFLTKGDVCTWKGFVTDVSGMKSVPYGVVCAKDGTIWGIYLDRMGMDGSIPNEIGMLQTLEVLDLTFNDKLVGRIPGGVCQLSNLDSLYLGHTHIAGEIPACIGQLKKLRSLFLSDTLMEGPLPTTLSHLAGMEELMLDNNGFSGGITTMFDDMPLLQYLFLEDNKLSATVGDTFLKSNRYIAQVDISDNDLVGVVPSHFFNRQSKPHLQLLDLHSNRLNGTLPENVPENNALLFVALQENSISGSIPISWAQNLTNLFHLDLSSNKLDGPMTPEIGSMTNLRYLFLANNPFDAGSIPDSFANLTNLQEFSLKSTKRQGNIPDFIGSGTTPWLQLVLLDLDDNALQGHIPDSLGNLKKLQFLLLNRNQLIGQVPTSLTNLVNLRAAFLESNQLTGDVDSTLCTLPNFSNTTSSDGQHLLVADCVSANVLQEQQPQQQQAPLTCGCCQICCMSGDANCHDNYDIASLDPQWQKGYNRVNYDFGNATRFVYRNFININLEP